MAISRLTWRSFPRARAWLLARTQLGYSVLDASDPESGYIEDDRQFSKTRNILATPLVQGNIALAITREGLLSAYRVADK